MNQSVLSEWFFTFGFGQGHDHCYVRIKATSYEDARRVMTAHFGDRWGFQYDSAEAAGVTRYHLHEISLTGEPL